MPYAKASCAKRLSLIVAFTELTKRYKDFKSIFLPTSNSLTFLVLVNESG